MYCAVFYLSTFSHDAVRILASPESIAGGAPNCKTGELPTEIKHHANLPKKLSGCPVTFNLTGNETDYHFANSGDNYGNICDKPMLYTKQTKCIRFILF